MTSYSFGELLDVVRDMQTHIARLETDLQTTREQVALLTEIASSIAPRALTYPVNPIDPSGDDSTPAFLKRQAK